MNRLKLKLIVILFNLLCFSFNLLSAANYNVSGYYKGKFSLIKYNNKDNFNFLENLLRVNLDYYPGQDTAINLAYDLYVNYFSLPINQIDQSNIFNRSTFFRVVDFKSKIADSPDFGIYHNLDRMNVAFSTSKFDFILGRQIISFGPSRVVNPTDIFIPITFISNESEDRYGIDAIRVRTPLSELGEIDLGLVFGEDFKSQNSAIFLGLSENLFKWDFHLILIYLKQLFLIGGDIQGNIKGAGFWLESAYNILENEKNFIRLTAGLDYKFTSLKDLTFFLEYHYNQNGSILNNNKHIRRVIYLRGHSYIMPGAFLELHPLINLTIAAITNVKDGSTLLNPIVEYNLKQDLYLNVGSYFNISSVNSEFSSYPYSIYFIFRYFL